MNSTGIVEFDVGGRLVKTLRTTLSQYSTSKLWKTVLRKDEEMRNANRKESESNNNSVTMDIEQIIID